MSALSERVHHGWLTKSPPSKGIFRPRWRRRWFVLKTGSYPNQFLLEYFTDESCKRQKGRINLDECEQLVGPLSVQDRHKHTFHIRTPSRTYYLAAESDAAMRKWIVNICHVCSLKTVDEEGEGATVYSKVGNQSNRPINGERQEEATESDDSSPTLSNKIPSGPYIPISECITGKPIPFITTADPKEVTYYNATVFQFPPEVNWATHPAKRELVDGEPTSSTKIVKNQQNSSKLAPPRPPKSGNRSISVKVTSPATTSKNPAIEVLTVSKTPISTEAEEIHDSSSTCSSLHSPPGSGGAVYSNISELNGWKHTKTFANQDAPLPSTSNQPAVDNCSTLPSLDVPPPVVDRNLKPLRREPIDTSPRGAINSSPNFPTSVHQNYTAGKTMTLPSGRSPNHRGLAFAGPVIDRTVKPIDGHLTLGPTPAQMKGHLHCSSLQRVTARTLPASSSRRAGPVISPNDKKSPFYRDDQSSELKLTYLQIDCQVQLDSPKIPNLHKKAVSNLHSDSTSSVEYRLIDPVMTKALSKTIEDREKQLRSNTLSHK